MKDYSTLTLTDWSKSLSDDNLNSFLTYSTIYSDEPMVAAILSELASRKRHDLIQSVVSNPDFTSSLHKKSDEFILAFQDNFLKNCITLRDNTLLQNYCAYILATGHWPKEEADLSSAQYLAEVFFDKNFGKFLGSLPNGYLRLTFGIQDYDYVKNSTTHDLVWMDTGEYHVLYLNSKKIHNKTSIPEILEFFHRHSLNLPLNPPKSLKKCTNYSLKNNLWIPLSQNSHDVAYFSFTPVDSL